MATNDAVNQLVTAASVMAPTAITGATPVVSTDFDVRTYAPGARFLLVFHSAGGDAENTGGAWVVQESLTDGGSYSASTLRGSLAATPAATASQIQQVALVPNPAKPFVQVKFTGADADTALTTTVVLIVVPRGM